jgi:dihydrolipoamide dehydrogenase
MKKFDFDVAIIGGGSGGFAAARTVTAAGLRTVVIEGGREVGGLCILKGCMPTKALLYAAEVKHLAQHGKTWGIHAGKVGYNFAQVMARKSAMVKEFADHRVKQLNSGKFKFIRARARFLDPHTLALSNGKRLTAKHFVISTGSVVAPFPLPELAQIGCLDSDAALSLKRMPKSLVVLGGGYVGVEFAQFFARLDVKVTIIQRGAHLLSQSDADASKALETVFKREGIQVFTNTTVTGASLKNGRKQIIFSHHGKTASVEAEEVLFAMGRVPNTANLGLDQAGVETDEGRIVCNLNMHTSAKHIFAAGDCAGPHEIVHFAVQQGETAGNNIARPRHPRRMDYRLLTTVVFTDPQVATVGLTEKKARTEKIPHCVAHYPFNDHGKSIIMDAMDGFVKLLADPKTGQIIGGSCVGPWGGELIHEIVAAMSKHMTVRELAALPHYHPTLAEIWTYPAEDLAERCGGERGFIGAYF